MDSTVLKKISSNAGAMFLSQGALALIPLLLTPYLARVLGVERYGLYAFGLSFIQIATIITDFGFSLSAVYRIARAEEDMNKIREIVGAVYMSKLCLCIIAVTILFYYPTLKPEYNEVSLYFYILALSIVGITLQPVWLFMGMEKLWKVTGYIIVSRVSYVVLTLMFVKKPEDLENAAFFNGITHILAGVIGVYFVYKIGAKPKWVSIKYTLSILKSSTEYFASQIALTLYGSGAVFFLGTFSTSTQVATYAVAELFYKGITALCYPMTSVLYPHMSRYRDINFFKKFLKIILLLTLLGLIIGLFSAASAIDFMFGQKYSSSHEVLIVLLFAVAVAIPCMLLGYPLLGAMGNVMACTQSILFASSVQLVSLLILYFADKFTALAVAITVLIAEICELGWRVKLSIPYLKPESAR
jgi:PST family polysaccharide transporter